MDGCLEEGRTPMDRFTALLAALAQLAMASAYLLHEVKPLLIHLA